MQEEKTILEIFTEIRNKLVSEGIRDLDLKFPIVGMEFDEEEKSNYLGLTWHESNEVQVHKIEMMIMNPITGLLFPMEALIPTLLHEFAHCLTKGEKFLIKDSKKALRNTKKFNHLSHNEDFYNNFARLLKTADLLGIYSLPPSPLHKFSHQNLRRFDGIDLAVAPLSACGSSKLYSSIAIEQRYLADIPEAVIKKRKLHVTLCNAQGVRKLITLEERSLSQLNMLVAQKFRCKAKKIFTHQGVLLDEKTLIFLQDGAVLNVV